MADNKTLTFLLMDAPFENARSTTGLRLVDAAVRKGHNVNVFAYEGGVGLTFNEQKPHPNKVHGRDADEEAHPLPKDWCAAIHKMAESKGVKFEWVNCGLCVDERGVNEALPFAKRGTPGDFLNFSDNSDNTLVIPTK